MKSFRILDIKQFMNKFLLTDSFDAFLFVEGTIKTGNTFFIDGRINKDFYDTSEAEELFADRDFSYYKELRPVCLDFIKGKRTPLGFQFVLHLSAKNTERLLHQSHLNLRPEDIQSLAINLRYDGTNLSCITAVSLKLFTLDKSLEHIWDDMVEKFLKQQEIPVELA